MGATEAVANAVEQLGNDAEMVLIARNKRLAKAEREALPIGACAEIRASFPRNVTSDR